MDDALKVPVQLRAGLAAAVAMAGLQVAPDDVTRIAVVVAWIVGGIADWWRERRRRRHDG